MPATLKAGARRGRPKKSASKSKKSMRKSVKKTVARKPKKSVAKKSTVKKVKRKPSAYNMHIKAEMKKGKSMKEAAASWKSKK